MQWGHGEHGSAITGLEAVPPAMVRGNGELSAWGGLTGLFFGPACVLHLQKRVGGLRYSR